MSTWYAVALAVTLSQGGTAQSWEGPRLAPVARQEVFEFTRAPTFRHLRAADGALVKDRYEISFAAKAHCDVAVAIEDSAGRIVNHIVYGVLGPNAPAPLQPTKLLSSC